MERREIGVLALVFLVLTGLIVWGVIAMHNWEEACKDAGGKVEERYERTDMVMTNTYDGKGNLTGITVIPTQVYSYHCWVNGKEIDPEEK
jgi:hypothetical protein